jgi:hypothetical protein
MELFERWRSRYRGMVGRCTVPDHPAYKNYGARGISVYEPWLKDRATFFEWAKLQNGWDKADLDMDRIDNNRGYYPDNIRLVSRTINANNRRSNISVEYLGDTYTYAEFRRKFLPKWRSPNAFTHHLSTGRSIEWIVGRHDNA